ncbi:MAG: formate dehydrogenase accessory protein FdhE [Proteobacteria bacterium]|nr:formate dehydrogenase accessory protein FdhE [Pseudomonadota bacterium]MCL2310145.1 formate dehydrogenase accessory protein FdhE [Pseudomonadota bacterium]
MSNVSSSASVGAIGSIAPLFLPNPVTLYETRARRLHALAEHEPSLRDYLLFVLQIVAVQHALSRRDNDAPAPTTTLHVDWVTPPLSMARLLQDSFWQESFTALLTMLLPHVPTPVQTVLERLKKLGPVQRATAARALLDNDTSLTGSDGAPFFWAALSLTAMQRIARSKIVVADKSGAARHLCPLCGNAPVASIVHPDGLRYLHCRLCESEWHVVRALCSNCESSRDIDYWSLEKQFPAIKAESCGDCRSYLKILYQKDDKDVDAVADDLVSLALDARLESEGFSRSSINPFLFPSS